MKTIYLVYSSDWESYKPYKCFAHECDAEDFVCKLEKIIETNTKVKDYINGLITKPKCVDAPEKPEGSYNLELIRLDGPVDSTIGGDLWCKAREKYKNDCEEYKKEVEKFREECDIYYKKVEELKEIFFKEKLTSEEYEIYKSSEDTNDNIGVEEIDYEDGE